MKQKTIATRHLRTKIAAGYVLILFVIFGIVYIWLNEQHRRQELEITSQKIRCLRKDIHEVYVKMVDLSLIGETVLDWNEEDMNIYHKKRLEVDSLLSLFKSSYRSERIDSVCRLLTEKENLLNKIMLVLNEQEEIKDKIARRVPVIARKSSQEEPPKRKRTGFLGLFGKKEEAKPTVTTSMLNTLNSDVIARQKEQSERLSQYTDSLSVRNRKLNCQLQGMIKKMDARIRTDLQQQETELAAIRRQSSVQVGGLTAVVALLLLLSYFIIHRNVKRICRYRKETSELIDKLQKTVQQNKQLLSARRKIMLTVTHELRTPLTAINGYGELLAQTEDENKRIEYTQNIRQAAGRMTDMLNSLLNFFRLDSGKEQANAVPFRLRNVAEILQTEFEPRAEAKDLTLHITGCSDVILMGDRNRLIQIGNNLLCNAIKFTESGTVGLDMTYDDGKLVLTVQDTGTGMSHEQKEKIFEPFERLPNAAVKDGFGLGLPIVKNTVTLLGGTVDVESEEGKGSRFTVKLPMPLADLLVQLCLKFCPVRKYGFGKFCQFFYMEDAGFFHSLDVLAGFKLQCAHRAFPGVTQPVERGDFLFCQSSAGEPFIDDLVSECVWQRIGNQSRKSFETVVPVFQKLVGRSFVIACGHDNRSDVKAASYEATLIIEQGCSGAFVPRNRSDRFSP